MIKGDKASGNPLVNISVPICESASLAVSTEEYSYARLIFQMDY